MHRSAAAYREAPDDESALIIRHKSLIDRVTRRVAARTGGAVSADELFSAGALGLIAAAQRFDPSRDVNFETFAEYRAVSYTHLDVYKRQLPNRAVRRLDSHDGAVPEAVWRLAETLVPRCQNLRGITLERMERTVTSKDVPLLKEELARVRSLLA